MPLHMHICLMSEVLMIQQHTAWQRPTSMLHYGSWHIIATSMQDAEHVMSCIHSLLAKDKISVLSGRLQMTAQPETRPNQNQEVSEALSKPASSPVLQVERLMLTDVDPCREGFIEAQCKLHWPQAKSS